MTLMKPHRPILTPQKNALALATEHAAAKAAPVEFSYERGRVVTNYGADNLREIYDFNRQILLLEQAGFAETVTIKPLQPAMIGATWASRWSGEPTRSAILEKRNSQLNTFNIEHGGPIVLSASDYQASITHPAKIVAVFSFADIERTQPQRWQRVQQAAEFYVEHCKLAPATPAAQASPATPKVPTLK